MNNYNNLKKTISIIAIVKIIMIVITFVITSILFRLLSKEDYGVFMAIFSLFSWLFLFDLGIGKGMRNYLTSSLTKKKFTLAKYYISTTYVAIFLITLILLIVVFSIISFLPLAEILNINNYSNTDIKYLTIIFTLAFLGKFFIGLVDNILHSTHQSHKTSLNGLYSNIIYLLALTILFILNNKDIHLIAWAYCFSVIIIYIYSNYNFFNLNKNLIPSVKLFSKKLLKRILNNGIYILFIQLGFIFILAMDKIILLKYVDSSIVTDYDILYKIMSIIILPAGIIIQPLWASFNAAYTKKDIKWIKNVFYKLYILFFLLFLLIFLIMIFFDNIMFFWLGDNNIIISNLNIFLMGIILLSLTWTNLHTNFFVATSNFKIVLLVITFSVIFKYASIYFLINENLLNLENILFSSFFSFLIYNLFAYFYLQKILTKKNKVNYIKKESLK